MENQNTPQSPDASKSPASPSDGDAAERVIQDAARKARELSKSREQSPIFAGATIVVGAKEIEKRGELQARVASGELVKLGHLHYRESTPAERIEREAKAAAMHRDNLAHEAERVVSERNRIALESRLAAETAFRESECPRRHVRDLGTVDANPKWLEVRDLLVAQALRQRGFLVALLGPSGTGKTQLAVSVIHRVCEHYVTARYVKALELFRDFRSAYTAVGKWDAGISEESIAEKWIAYGLLVIDEAHLRAGTEFEQRTIVNMLDRRYDEMRATILIANQGKQEFAEQVGPSVISRIHQTGEAIICDWPSYRKPGSWRQE